MSASLNKGAKWDYRIFAQRPILVKDKNELMRKLVVTDLTSTLLLPLEVPEDFPIESIKVEKEYTATFRIYTSKRNEDVEQKYIEFFESIDVDQSVEEFIRIYWIYPNHTKFVLSDLEEV